MATFMNDTTPSDIGALFCTAFAGFRSIASGGLMEVALQTKEAIDHGEEAPILIFDNITSQPIEVDFRGTLEDVQTRLEQYLGSANNAKGTGAVTNRLSETDTPRRPGRPKLGVVAREVTLLPRHWAWLNDQPGGASVALRQLVEDARHVNESADRVRRAREATYRFMSALAGNLPGFEDATRALFASDQACLHALIGSWPIDVRNHVHQLSSATFVAS